jgi:hypothetical protein
MTIDGLKRASMGGRDRKIAYATHIMWNADKTKVGIYHHDSLIAVIDESGTAGHKRVVSVSTAGYGSQTTIHRIREILRANTRGYYGARIKNFEPLLTCTQSHVSGGGEYDVFNGHNFVSIIVNDIPSTDLYEGYEYPSNVLTDGSLYNGVH